MRSLPPLPWRTSSRRSAQAQSARSNPTASAQQTPVSSSVRRIARSRRPTTVLASQQAIRRAISAGASGGTILWGRRTLRRPREGVVVGVAGGAQPGAEAAHLAEVAVTGVGAAGGEEGEVGDDVVGAEAVRAERCRVLLQAAGEARRRDRDDRDRHGRQLYTHDRRARRRRAHDRRHRHGSCRQRLGCVVSHFRNHRHDRRWPARSRPGRRQRHRRL